MNEYSLFENIKYILKVVKEKDRILLAEMTGMGLISAFLPYIVPYLSKAAVSCIVNGTGFEKFAIVVILFTAIFIVWKTINNTINLSLWWRFFALKNEFLRRLGRITGRLGRWNGNPNEIGLLRIAFLLFWAFFNSC